MRAPNIFDSEDNDEEIQILLAFQSSKHVKLKIISGKLFGNLDDLGCPYLIDLAICAEKLVIEFLGHPDSYIFSTQVGDLAGNHVIPSSAVAFKNTIPADETRLEELFVFLDKFISLLITPEHGAHQGHLFLKLTSGLQATLERTADEFLLSHGDKQIKSPINFLFGNHKRLIHGKFLPKPKISETDSKPIDLEGFFDGYKLHKHELYVLNERGNQITIYFNISKDIDTILDLAQSRHHPMIFVVQEKLDAKSMETFKLITVKPIDYPPSLKLEPTE